MLLPSARKKERPIGPLLSDLRTASRSHYFIAEQLPALITDPRSPWSVRIHGATMAGHAVDESLLRRLCREILHLEQLLIDPKVHHRHLARRSLGSLLIAREIPRIVAVRARHAERLRVANVHDYEERLRWHIAEVWELDVLEHRRRRVLFAASDSREDRCLHPVVESLNRVARGIGCHSGRWHGWLCGGCRVLTCSCNKCKYDQWVFHISSG